MSRVIAFLTKPQLNHFNAPNAVWPRRTPQWHLSLGGEKLYTQQRAAASGHSVCQSGDDGGGIAPLRVYSGLISDSNVSDV